MFRNVVLSNVYAFEMWFCLMFMVCKYLVRSDKFVDLAPVCHRTTCLSLCVLVV